MVSRFQGSGRTKEGGYLATHKQDFNAHYTGGDFRHGADDVDMNPPLSLYPTGTTVQKTLELLSAGAGGAGFVSVGDASPDGYALGTYNVGTSDTPTLRDALLAAFNDERVQNGGIIFILPGTYYIITTVEVPAGITILGETSGTIIIGEMSEEPMFRFLRSKDFPTIGGDSGGGEISAEVGSPVDQSGLVNLILCDNLDGYGGSLGISDSTMQTVPMVEMETSARLNVENVKFLGRVDYGPVPDRGKTYCAVGTVLGGSTGTYLTMRRCFFDGMRNGINFAPGNGDLDHLTIDLCRARIFGSEASVPTTIAEGSFANMSLCNLVATNNYVFGYGTFPTQFVAACFTVTSITTGSGSDDVSILVTGTSGSPSSGLPLTGLRSVFYNEAGVTSGSNWSTKAVVTGNNWSADVDSKWFVTVGAGGNVVDDGAGDFLGPSAIDLLLSYGGGSEYPVTVIVNEGTYEVTVDFSGFSDRYNFIGNEESGRRPIFDMNQGAGLGTDPIGNRRFVTGARIENIHFRSNNATTGTTSFHSIRPTSNTAVFVKNCLFNNCTLSIDELTPRIEVIDCEFRQDDTLPDNLSLLAPRQDYVLVEGCSFYGNGYAGFIGYDSGLSYGGSANRIGRIVVRDCVMDINAPTFGINDASPTTVKGYFVVDTTGGGTESHMVEISGCQIVTNSGLSQETAVIGGVISGMTAWVFVRASTIQVDGCIIASPTQTKSFGVPFPGALFTPNRTAKITNSQFYDGGVPCQISGLAGNFGLGDSDGVLVDGCRFVSTSDILTLTMLDIDLRVTFGSPTAIGAKVIVSNNTFRHTDSTDDLAVQQFDVTGVSYFAHGVVQIYAFAMAVDFHNNHVESFIPSSTPVVSGVSHVSGVSIHNNINTTGNKAENITPINVHDNEIFITSDSPAFNAGDFISSLALYGMFFDVHDNHIRFYNSNWPSTGWVGCAYFDSQLTETGGIAPDSMVHNNSFMRKNRAGSTLSSIDNYVYITATSLPGRLVENIFDSEYTSGVLTTLVLDNSSSWYVYQNKNQTVTASMKSVGTFTIGDIIGDWAGGTTSSIEDTTDASTFGSPTVFYYTESGSPLRLFRWLIGGRDLPHGVQITKMEALVESTSPPDTTNQFYIRIEDDTLGTETSAVHNPTSPSNWVTLNVSGTYINNLVDRLRLILYWRADHSVLSTRDCTIHDFRITYRWV
jgi:hypothetical protein